MQTNLDHLGPPVEITKEQWHQPQPQAIDRNDDPDRHKTYKNWGYLAGSVAVAAAAIGAHALFNQPAPPAPVAVQSQPQPIVASPAPVATPAPVIEALPPQQELNIYLPPSPVATPVPTPTAPTVNEIAKAVADQIEAQKPPEQPPQPPNNPDVDRIDNFYYHGAPPSEPPLSDRDWEDWWSKEQGTNGYFWQHPDQVKCGRGRQVYQQMY